VLLTCERLLVTVTILEIRTLATILCYHDSQAQA
jgi:hypothetical protein